MKNSQSNLILLTFPGSVSAVGMWVRFPDDPCQVGAGLEDNDTLLISHEQGASLPRAHTPPPCGRVIMGTLENHTKFFHPTWQE